MGLAIELAYTTWVILFCFIKVETFMDAIMQLILPKWTPYQGN